MNLIGLMTVRNEAWCLRASAACALRWCDSLVILDHASTDATPAIIDALQSDYPNRVHRVRKDDGDWAEMQHRQETLEMARSLRATHCAIVDADELLSVNYARLIREWISDLSPGQLLRVPLLSCWRSLDCYRTDAHPLSWAMASLAFNDSSNLHWKCAADGYQWHHRQPYGSFSKDIGEHRLGGVLHIQHANWRRLLSKQALYVARETLKFGHVRANYRGTVDENGLETHAVPADWWGEEKSLIELDAEPWQEAELRRLILSDPDKFCNVDLFGARELARC